MTNAQDISASSFGMRAALQDLSKGDALKCSTDSDRCTSDLTKALRHICGESDVASLDEEQVTELIDRLLQCCLTDELTGLSNRRMLQWRLREEHERSLRSEHEFSVLMLDLDFFKRVNDMHGHQEGDRILKEVAETTWSSLRRTDFLARYGGEEFCGILPDTRVEEAFRPAERVRRTVEELDSGAPTVSIGVAGWRPWLSPEELLARADQALYAAKEGGRNRVESYAMVPSRQKERVSAT